MKRPSYRRMPKERQAVGAAAGVDLGALANRVTYGGSVYHKDVPSFAGDSPRPRPNASICPRSLAHDRKGVESRLRTAIRLGNVSENKRGDFPHLAWLRVGDIVYEACPSNQETGEYHGYPLQADDVVKGLREPV